MNKKELITAVSKESQMAKKNSETVLNAIMEVIRGAMKRKDKVTLVGFGTWEVRKRAARKGVNPRTKETIEIAETEVPIFRAGKLLKSVVLSAVKVESKK